MTSTTKPAYATPFDRIDLFDTMSLSDDAQPAIAAGMVPMATIATPRDVSFDTQTGKAVELGMIVHSTAAIAETADQWHLGYLGDMVKIWQDFTGKGVKVGVFDDGTQGWHWDLDANYDASNHLNVDGWVIDGSWDGPYHGTAVSGLIAAERNDRGGVGVAYDAKLSAVPIYTS